MSQDPICSLFLFSVIDVFDVKMLGSPKNTDFRSLVFLSLFHNEKVFEVLMRLYVKLIPTLADAKYSFPCTFA